LNYFEELAYWYFRLNGFFLIHNFVNHQSEGLKRTHETDLLGIRFPYVSEEVGWNRNDYDSTIVSDEKIVCIIAEVKSGNLTQNNRNNLFNNKKIISNNICRMGFFPRSEISPIVKILSGYKSWENDKYKILKVLVEKRESKSVEYISIGKERIVNEIHRRKEMYRKEPDRLFFSSNLIQYIFSD